MAKFNLSAAFISSLSATRPGNSSRYEAAMAADSDCASTTGPFFLSGLKKPDIYNNFCKNFVAAKRASTELYIMVLIDFNSDKKLSAQSTAADE